MFWRGLGSLNPTLSIGRVWRVSMEPFRVQGFGALGIERSLGFKGPGGVSALIS